MVNVTPLEKYELDDDVRIHNEYTPALAPVSTTVSAIDVDDENADATLVTALVGLPHAVDDTTNADPSPFTFTRPTPTNATATEATAGITVGETDVTDTMSNVPIKKYGDDAVHRPHS